MNVFAVPSKTPAKGDTSSHDAATGAAVQGLIATFSDMLRNAGIRMESDAGSLKPKAEAAATERDAKPAERTQNARPERRDDATAAPAERPHREREASQRTRKDDTKSADRSAASEKAGRAKTPASSAAEESAPASSPESDGVAERPAEPTSATPETAAGGDTATPTDPATPQDDALATLGQMVETAVTSAETPPPSSADFVAGVAAVPSSAESATPGADTASVGDDLRGAVTAAGQGAKASDAALAAATAPTAPQTASASAAAAEGEGEAPTAGDATLNAADLKVQQAAALSRLTGSGNLIAVRTTVTEPSAQLVSQPAATLSAPTVAATADPATSAAPVTAPAAQAAPPAPTVQAALAGTEASPLARQNQQAEAQMARAQGASVAADAAKTLVQATGPAGSTGMQTSSGGGESLAGSGAQTAFHTPAAQHGPQAQAASQPRFTVAQQAAVDQVSVQISKAIKDGVDRINIQLRPEHLGRVDVRLEVTDGRVSATVTADSKETLDMLQRDARELERALQQAGLQTDTGSLNFSLRGQQGQGQESDRQVAGGRFGQETLAADEAAAETPAWTDYPGGIRPDGRIDIRA